MWVEEEKQYLKQHYSTVDNHIIAAELRKLNPNYPKELQAIRTKASRMKLKKNCRWQPEEVEYLQELLGEYPSAQIQTKMELWWKNNNFYPKSKKQIFDKINNLKAYYRLNASAKFITVLDFQYLLGCSRATANHLFKDYRQDLQVKYDGRVQYVTPIDLKRLFIKYPMILERHKTNVDMIGLVELFK